MRRAGRRGLILALLVLWQVVVMAPGVHRGKHIAKSPYIQKLYNPLLDTIAEVLRSGIDKGVFRSDCEAQDLFISLNGMGYFLLSNQYTLSVILGRNLSTPKALKRHEDHIVAVVLGYLRRDAAAS